MEYLLFHPKNMEYCISPYGITDILFNEGWRVGDQQQVVKEHIMHDFEFRGYILADPPTFHNYTTGDIDNETNSIF